jgi:hypothetical protein
MFQLMGHISAVFTSTRRHDNVKAAVASSVPVAERLQSAGALAPIDITMLLKRELTGAAHPFAVELQSRPLVGDNAVLTEDDFFRLFLELPRANVVAFCRGGLEQAAGQRRVVVRHGSFLNRSFAGRKAAALIRLGFTG